MSDKYSIILVVHMVWQQPLSKKAPYGHTWRRSIDSSNFESKDDIARILQVAKNSISGVVDVISAEIAPDRPQIVAIIGTRSKNCSYPESKFDHELLEHFNPDSGKWMDGDISIPVEFSSKQDAVIWVSLGSFQKHGLGYNETTKAVKSNINANANANTNANANAIKIQKMKNKNVVVSGFVDPKLKTYLENNANLQTSVSKQTDYLIVRNRDKKSTKLIKADLYGVQIVLLDSIKFD